MIYESEEVYLGNNVWAQYVNDGVILSVKVARNAKSAAGIVLKEDTLVNLNTFIKITKQEMKKKRKAGTK